MSLENTTVAKKPKSAFLSDKSKSKRKLTTFLIPSDVSSKFNENDENLNSSSSNFNDRFNFMQFCEKNHNSLENKQPLTNVLKNQRLLGSYGPFFNPDNKTTEERLQFQDSMEKNSYLFNYFSSKSASTASALAVPDKEVFKYNHSHHKSTDALNKPDARIQKLFNSKLDSIMKTNQINYRNKTHSNSAKSSVKQPSQQQHQHQSDELNTNSNNSLFPCLVKKPQPKHNDYASRSAASPTSFSNQKDSVYFIHTYSYIDFNIK